MKVKGKVIEKSFGKNSKSEHQAVYLQTDDGDYVLRMKGDNPFENTALRKLVGKDVIATGVLKEYLFLASDIKEL